MRQVGILAAACLYALDNNIDRLAVDHERARRIGEIVESIPRFELVFPVDTNIVIFRLADDSDGIEELKAGLEREGVLALTFGGRFMRLVTHLDVPDDAVSRLEGILKRIAGS